MNTIIFQAKPRTIADNISVSFDPYQRAIDVFEIRHVDSGARTVTFVFKDASELTFDVSYRVREL